MKRFLLLAMLALIISGQWSTVDGQNYKNASEPDKMWGYYCYRAVPVKGVTVDPDVYRETDTKTSSTPTPTATSTSR